MKKLFLVLSGVLLLFNTLSSQSQNTIYYNSKWETVSKKVYYQYYREYTKTDSGYAVKDYYRDQTVQMEGLYSDKKMKSRTGYFTYYSQYNGKSSEGRYENNVQVGTWRFYDNNGNLSSVRKYDSEGKLNGTSTSYHENGAVYSKVKYKHGKLASDTVIYYDSLSNIIETVTYVNGKQNGRFNVYYTGGKKLNAIVNYADGELDDTCFYYFSNGKLASWEIYNEGKLDRRKCFEVSGEVTDCTEKNYVMPTMDEDKSIGKYLQEKVVYPKKAIEDGAQGTVKFSFRVDTAGKVYNLVIIEAVHPSFKRQIEKAVNGMGALTPAMLHNRNYDDYMEFTYHFTLQK
jgi:antitoxin component YwqK of YwqJK toxin-antitoxin module